MELQKRFDGLANGNGSVHEAPNGATFQHEGSEEVSSNTINPRRWGKLALFEGAPPPTDVTNLPEDIAGGVATGIGGGELMAVDNPRKVAEETAGRRQLFETLFAGGGDESALAEGGGSGGAAATANGTGNAGKSTPIPVPSATRPGGATPEAMDGKGGDSGRRSVVDGVKENEGLDAWWLDALFPTNEEMSIPSKNVRRRTKQLKDYILVTSDWISYALIDGTANGFGPLIQGIEHEVDSIDETVLILKDTDQTDMLRGEYMQEDETNVYGYSGLERVETVMGLLRLMGDKADVVKGLVKRCNENRSVAPKSDIDHLITMPQNRNHYEKILSRSHSNYLAQISIEMTDANNQINDVLSKLTALGTVLIPMNLVTVSLTSQAAGILVDILKALDPRVWVA
ncbi:CorA metal ion transporter [Ceratobasidium sp. 395]|nr:CorA metal ion transporter [Ceratobasidium sp. 395]